MGTLLKGGRSPARSGSLAARIANTLQNEIIAGSYKPGQRLVERQIIERFRVSSIPVREAFLDLEGRGLLVRRHNVGCSVIKLTPKEAARICELRRTLEPKVVEWACERIAASAVASLEKQLAKLERAASRRDFPSFFQEDIAFHRMIWAAADNPFAARSLDIVMGSLFAAGLIGGEQKATLDLVAEVEKHRRLFAAIRQRDACSAAMALMDIAVGFEKNVPLLG